MPQETAVQLYTGSHWRVEAATLADVEHFTKFAVSTRGLTAHFQFLKVTLLPSLGRCPSSLLLIHGLHVRTGHRWMLEAQNVCCGLQFTVLGAAIQGPTNPSEFACAADWSLWLWWQQCQQHLGSALQEPHPREQGGQGPAEKGHPQQVRGLSMPRGLLSSCIAVQRRTLTKGACG